MAEELRIRVIFETGEAKKGAEDLAKAGEVASNSLAGMQKRVNELQKAFLNARDGTREQIKAYQDYQNAVTQLGASQLRLNSALSTSTRTSASMTMALQSMNFTIRDSPYFFRDFSLGILAIGNNLNPLIDNLIRVKQEANLVGTTMTRSLFTALSGTNGVIFLFSVLVTVLQAVTFAMSSNRSEANKLAEEYDKLGNKVERMSRGILTAELQKQKAELRDITDRMQEWNDQQQRYADISARRGEVYTVLPFQGKGADKIPTLKENIKLLEDQLATLGDIENLERRIAENRARQRAVRDNKELVQAYEEEIKKDQQRIKELRGIVDVEKESREVKQKALIETEAELKAQRSQLEVLRAQSKSAYDRLQYTKEIETITYRLAEISRLPDFSDVGYQAGQFITPPDQLQPNFENMGLLRQRANQGVKDLVSDTQDELQLINTLSSQVGNSLFQAFIQGKMGADELFKSLLAVTGQLVFIEGLKYIFSGGILGLFGAGTQRGGVMGFTNGGVYWGNSMMPYDNLQTRLAPQEMVLNRQQTLNLFNAIRSGDFASLGGGKTMEVKITGSIESRKNKFVADFERAKTNYNRSKVIGNVSNS